MLYCWESFFSVAAAKRVKMKNMLKGMYNSCMFMVLKITSSNYCLCLTYLYTRVNKIQKQNHPPSHSSYLSVSNPEKVFYDKDASETGEQYYDDKPTRDQKEDKDVPLKYINEGPTGRKLEDDQHSYNSGKGRRDVQGGDTDSRRYDNDLHRGSRDRLDDRRDHNSGSRDRLDDQHDRYGGSRDRLEDQRDRYGGSRDRLEDQHDRYGGSRDRLDDRHDRYGGSRDRLDDRRDHYGGSRDRLDDQRDRYGGSRDRLDDRRDRYGSRDRLDNESDRYGGGSNHYRGSRDRLDYNDDHH